jgi:eukaryotic-like serine/threonine-protein kinase
MPIDCCGRDMSSEGRDQKHGENLCESCKSGSGEPALRLLEEGHGNADLALLRSCSMKRELGRGGFSVVYLVRNYRTDEQLALKLLLPQVAVESQANAAFVREMANASTLDHPNVVRLRGHGLLRNAVCFSLWEFCDGGRVDQLLERRVHR